MVDFATVKGMDVFRAARELLVGGAVLVVAVSAAVGLAGCTDSEPEVTVSPAPVITPAVSEAPSVSASPDVSPSPVGLSDEELLAILPPGAERADLQGAVVTAEFFLAEYSRMFSSGNTSIWSALSRPDCQYCASALENAVHVQSEGFNAEGGQIVARSNTIEANLSDDGSTFVKLKADVEEARLESRDGVQTVSEPAGTAVFTMKFENVGGIWRVNGVEVDG